jgi:hypothetical protein
MTMRYGAQPSVCNARANAFTPAARTKAYARFRQESAVDSGTASNQKKRENEWSE